MNEAVQDVAQTAAGDGAQARLEKEMTTVKNDVAHLSRQISEVVNALAAVAQNEARRGLKRAGANVDWPVSDISYRAAPVADAARNSSSSLGETLERPVVAVTMALAIGFLIGVTWRR